MSLSVVWTATFKRDYKRAMRRRLPMEELDGVLAAQRFGGDIKEFGAAKEQVFLDLVGLRFGERGVEKMGHTLLARSIADGIHLVFHQRDEGRNHDGSTLANHSRELIAERFTAASGHDDKSILTIQNRLDDSFLVAFETIETKYFLQLCMQIHHNPKKTCNFAVQSYEKFFK